MSRMLVVRKKRRLKNFITYPFIALVLGCNSSSSTHKQLPVDESCSVSEASAALDSALALTASEVDFTFALERIDGLRYSYERGNSTLQTRYESASTSKLVSAAIILRLVDQGVLNLTDRPQDRIEEWPIANNGFFSNIMLSHLLGFTSGLENDPLCVNLANVDFDRCVINIANSNIDLNHSPGERFYYSSSHLQVAGLMAIRASGSSTWDEVFSKFKDQTGLFSTAAYDLPSEQNPRLAGGMHWTGEEYIGFLQNLMNSQLLSTTSMNALLSDQTANAEIIKSPALDALGEEWHYGFGLWHECENDPYNCTPGTRVSSAGAFGAYPFWDVQKEYVGLVARQGAIGSFQNGITIERNVRFLAELWADCDVSR